MEKLFSSNSEKLNQSGKLFNGLNNLPSSPMDPVSILSTIGAVGSVANSVCALAFQLYTFIEDTKHVDQAVADLVEEVNALNSILEAVKLGLESDAVRLAEQRANSDDSRLLWESIQGSLANCQLTIDRLEKAIVDIRPGSKNFAKQAIRRLKLNLKEDEISAFRAQVRTHTNTLHMALLMVNLRAACLAPGVVTDELGPKIDELRSIMERVHGSEADLTAKALGVEPDYLRGLQRSAQRVISGATTVSANSEAAGSIWGDVMDDEKRYTTLSWIPEPAIHEEHDGPSIAPPMSEDYAISHTTALTDYSASNAGEAESDSDGDFESELVETYFARGTKKFDEGKFAEAQPILQKGLQSAEKLPLKRRQPKQIAEVKLMIATCIYHSPNPNEAEDKLFAITQEKIHESVTDEGAIRRCQASHLLAGVLFRQQKYAPAKSFCRKALIGRRRVLGKTHISHYESLSLLSQIFEAEGEYVDAETYWAMIPEDVASKLVKMKDQFPDLPQNTSGSLAVPKAHPRKLSAGEISPTTLLPSDNTRFGRSPSEPQLASMEQGSNPIPINRAGSQSHSPTASPRLPSQASPSSSRGSTSPRLATALLHRTTLAQRPVSTASTATSSSVEEMPVQRKPSIWSKLKGRQASVSSTANAAPAEVSVIQEEESVSNVTVPDRPLPPRRTSSNVSNPRPRKQSFLEYLEERDSHGDVGNHWPGLN
jgi:tetratricopeptide (TPR) repeat protein